MIELSHPGFGHLTKIIPELLIFKVLQFQSLEFSLFKFQAKIRCSRKNIGLLVFTFLGYHHFG